MSRDEELLKLFAKLKYDPPAIKFWLIGLACFFDILLMMMLYRQNVPPWILYFLFALLCSIVTLTVSVLLFDRYMKEEFSEMNAYGLIELIRKRASSH